MRVQHASRSTGLAEICSHYLGASLSVPATGDAWGVHFNSKSGDVCESEEMDFAA